MAVFEQNNLSNCVRIYKALITTVALGFTLSVQAQQPAGVDSGLDMGLDMDFDVTDSAPQGNVETGKPWRLHASYLQSWSVPGDREIRAQHADLKFQFEKLFNQLYTVADLTLLLRGRDDPQTDADKNYQMDSRIQSLYGQASLGDYSIKIGYQTVVWGKMDMLGATDKLSPWDFSQFAFTAPQDARVGQGILTASHFIRTGLEAEFVYNATPKTNRYPGGGAEYLLQQQVGLENASVVEDKPEAFTDYELALRLKLSTQDFDGTFTIARLLQNEPVFESTGPMQFKASYPVYDLFASSYNFTGDGKLWKLAVAYSRNKSYATPTGPIKADSLQWGAGLEINVNDDYNIGLEAAYTYSDLPEFSGVERNTTQVAMRLTQDFYHNTLDGVYYAQYHLEDRAQTHSVSLKYHLMDDWSVELVQTIIKVNDDNAPSKATDNWDSLSMSTVYSW